MNILFFYTELADYTLACMKALKSADPRNNILVIHYPVNPEAPFRFDFEGIGEFICVDRFGSYEQLRGKAAAFRPDRIVCCGWINKWYVRCCREMRRKALCILTMDNHWNGSLKQQVWRLLSLFTLTRVYKKIWVPGAPQAAYAKKLGFNANRIMTGFYSCDLDRFNEQYASTRAQKEQAFPRRLLCVARYIPAKNYRFLWETFIKWKAQEPSDWVLCCAGTGEEYAQRITHPDIRHLGFVQKEEWPAVIEQTRIFILPSLFEPWGVVVHEFAAAGYPLLLSKQVGAAAGFLTAANGSSFDPGNEAELMNAFRYLNSLGNDQLVAMAKASHQQAQQISPASWAARLLQA